MAQQQSGGGVNIGVSTGYTANGGAQVGGVDQAGLSMRTGGTDWSQFFGPSKGPIETAPYGSYRRENFALPDAYRGSNVYMTNVIITLVTEQELWPVKVALPWRLTESEMEIAWDQIIFDNTLLGQVPEEGVSRLVTQQISERKDHYVRYGLGFMLEHGFMKTDRGRLCYRMNLEQIRNAILETAYLGVLDAYLRCKRPSYMGSIRAGMQRLSGRSLQKALTQEVEQFAMIQKTEYGFDLLDSIGKRALKLIGVTPDLWILPEGMKMYLNMVRKENFQSPNAGANGAIAPVGSRALVKPTDIAVDVANNCQVVETKSFELPNMSEPINPLERPATIGEYYVMQNHLRGQSNLSGYRSAWRDIFIYNEDKDGFTRISMDVALRNCSRFDADGDLAKINCGANAGDGDVPPDMFLRRSEVVRDGDHWVPTEHMGDIHPMYLRDAGLGDWADSCISKLLSAEPGIARALRDGVDMCRKIDAVDSSEGAQDTWFMWLWLMHVLPRVPQQWNDEHGLPYPPTLDDTKATGAGNAFWTKLCSGVPTAALLGLGAVTTVCPPMMDMVSGAMKALPVGYASWPGMTILANPRYKTTFGQHHEVAVKFIAAFETLYSTLRQHMNDSVFMDGRNAPPWFKARDGRSTLFANLIYVSDAPVWLRIRPKSVAAGATPSTEVHLPDLSGMEFTKNDGSLVAAPGGIRIDDSQVLNLTSIMPFTDGDFGTDDMAFKGSYSQWLDKVRSFIRSNIFDIQDVGAPEDSTFGRILDRFIDFFSRNPVALSANRFAGPTGVVPEHMGVMLVQKFVGLMQKLKKAKQPADTDGGNETPLYRVAAFVNMGATAASMKAFVEFMKAAHDTLSVDAGTDEEYYTADFPMEWGTSSGKKRTSVLDNGTEHQCMRDRLDKKILQSAGFKYGEIPEYEINPSDGGAVKLPFNAIEYGDEEKIMPTHLVAGAGLRSIMTRWEDGAKKMAAFAMVVAVDPFGHVPGLDSMPAEDSRQRYADRSPPLFNKPRATYADNASKKKFFGAGSKRSASARFGASSAGMPPRKGGARHAFEDDDDLDEPMEHAIEMDPWNVGESRHSSRDFSKAFQDRYRAVVRAETDPLRRCFKLCFMGQPVCYGTFLTIINNDNVFPFGFLLLRPYITYSMASAILTVGGSGTGETLVGHADFQLADNIVQKMHIGNFTMYLKSVVYQPHHVWIADNIMATGYIGGNNCDFRRADGPTDPPGTASDPSIFACLVPYECTQEGSGQQWESEFPNPLDITGDYSTGNPALASLRTAVQHLHYATALFYRQVFGWDNSDQNMSDDSYGTNNRYNTLCFSGHYMMYNLMTQRYDLVSTGTGHRGERVYPGCGRVWRGLAKLLEPVNYSTTHGGAPIRSLVTNAV